MRYVIVVHVRKVMCLVVQTTRVEGLGYDTVRTLAQLLVQLGLV